MLENFSKKQKTTAVIIALSSVLFFILMYFIFSPNNLDQSSLKKDAYGDLVETKPLGQLNTDNSEQTFSLQYSSSFYDNFGPEQSSKVNFLIKTFIWDNINGAEKKAVMLDENLSSEKEISIHKSKIKTNNAKTTFDLIIYSDYKLDIQKIEAILDNKLYVLTSTKQD
jgi:hypothetical protein